MKYFMDTEFSERGPEHPIELISIGIVSESGNEFYAVSIDFDEGQCNPWVRDHVLPLLPDRQHRVEGARWMPRSRIAENLSWFIVGEPEFWGYYSDYDWVVFCQLFGDMGALPKGWPMRCNDLRQWLDHEALNHVSQPDDAPHDALQDARWIRATYLEYVRKQWGDAA